mmetsp:Transcript_18411/g.46562  ORF Transcript_18411/g.46562 Transcript_18411/m.46562 type:complete len:279 (+) Transcript_18411:209-1045(+)
MCHCAKASKLSPLPHITTSPHHMSLLHYSEPTAATRSEQDLAFHFFCFLAGGACLAPGPCLPFLAGPACCFGFCCCWGLPFAAAGAAAAACLPAFPGCGLAAGAALGAAAAPLPPALAAAAAGACCLPPLALGAGCCSSSSSSATDSITSGFLAAAPAPPSCAAVGAGLGAGGGALPSRGTLSNVAQLPPLPAAPGAAAAAAAAAVGAGGNSAGKHAQLLSCSLATTMPGVALNGSGNCAQSLSTSDTTPLLAPLPLRPNAASVSDPAVARRPPMRCW